MKKIISLVLTLAMCMQLAACGKKNQNAGSSDLPKGVVSYPIKTEETLTVWMPLPSQIAGQVSNFGETPFAKNLEEATGIKIIWQHPAQGQTDALNLLLASKELPDIIFADWLTQGPSNYIDKKLILSLNQLMDDYAPNMKKYMNEHKDIKKLVTTDSGDFYSFPFVRGDKLLTAPSGFMLRSDWLDELGLDVPETIDDWDNVLAAFKDKCEIPLAVKYLGVFSSGFNAFNCIYVKNNKVTYGPAEKEMKDLFVKLNEWYNKGYIDKNFSMLDTQKINSNMLSSVSDVSFGAGGGMMGAYLDAKQNDSFDLVAAPYPVAKKGDRAQYSMNESYFSKKGAAITATCKNPELAARFLDFGYSEEGMLFYNFGKEGESYDMVDGYPTYKKELFDTSDGRSVAEKLTMNCLGSNEGPFIQDRRYLEQYYGRPQQQNALKQWSDNDFEKYRLPELTLTLEESMEYNAIMTDVNTYASEMFAKFIIGTEPIDNFDNYVEKLKSLKVDRAMELQQAAYDRFLKR